MKSLFNFFLRGLLLVFPVGTTIYIIYALVFWMDDKLTQLFFEPFNVNIPGLGIISVFFMLTVLGYLGTLAFTRPILKLFERILTRTPLVKILYSAIKELTEAFLGDKKKFTRPVMIDLNDSGVKKLGFITHDDLSDFGMEDLVAVYCPHSYNFSGNLFLVPRSHVTSLQAPATDMMKYVVSAGVTKVGSHK